METELGMAPSLSNPILSPSFHSSLLLQSCSSHLLLGKIFLPSRLPRLLSAVSAGENEISWKHFSLQAESTLQAGCQEQLSMLAAVC